MDDSEDLFSDGVYRVGRFVAPPQVIQRPSPPETETKGQVTMQGVVGSDGIPRDIRVIQSSNHELDDLAIKTVLAWRFHPAHKRRIKPGVTAAGFGSSSQSAFDDEPGEPVAVAATFELHFGPRPDPASNSCLRLGASPSD